MRIASVERVSSVFAPHGIRGQYKPRTGPIYCQKCPTDMMLEPFVHYVVNTNYARQVEFTER